MNLGVRCSTLTVNISFIAPDVSDQKLEVDTFMLNNILNTGEYASLPLASIIIPAFNLEKTILCRFEYDFAKGTWRIS